MESVIVIGGGQFGQVCAEIIKLTTGLELLGFLDDNIPVGTKTHYGNIIGKIEEIKQFHSQNERLKGIIAIGNIENRIKIHHSIQKSIPSFKFETLIHPKTSISSTTHIGEGVCICSGSIVGVNSVIGDHSYCYSNVTIEHDCELGSFIGISSSVTLGGGVTVGNQSFLGLGSKVIHGKNIEKKTILGAGALLLGDTKENSIYYGAPAKFIRNRREEENYL